MNFYKEYNSLESNYINDPATSKCFRELSVLFASLLDQLMNQIKNKSNINKIDV